MGIDHVDVAEVARAVETHGQRYLRHVFTDAEQTQCLRGSSERRVRLLAERFAAKEAARKVVRADLRWLDIEVRGTDAPELEVVDPGWSLLVSMASAGGRATAVVIGERR